MYRVTEPIPDEFGTLIVVNSPPEFGRVRNIIVNPTQHAEIVVVARHGGEKVVFAVGQTRIVRRWVIGEVALRDRGYTVGRDDIARERRTLPPGAHGDRGGGVGDLIAAPGL